MGKTLYSKPKKTVNGSNELNVQNKKERIKRYRRYVFAAGALSQSEKGNVKVIDKKALKKGRRREFELRKRDSDIVGAILRVRALSG